jgi:hypothetical protein
LPVKSQDSSTSRDGARDPPVPFEEFAAIFFPMSLWTKVWAMGGAVGTALLLWACSHGGTTLVETEVAGSSELLREEKVRAGRIEFVVEHPGVKHQLQVWPKEADDAAVAQKNFGVVSFVLSVTDASGKQIHYENVVAQNGQVAESSFTPAQNGPHTLEVATPTRGIPKIHVLLSDPKKKNGKRMNGY